MKISHWRAHAHYGVLLAALWLILPRAARAQTPPANREAILRPLAAEIALEGEVRAFDATTGVLQMLAGAFVTPNGRRDFERPRSKTVIVDPQTRLFDGSGAEFVGRGRGDALKSLSSGARVRVVGREVAGQPFKARALSRSGLAPAPPVTPPKPDASAVTAPLPPHDAPPFLAPATVAALLPAAQNVAGVTVRVLDAGFAPQVVDAARGTGGAPIFSLVMGVTPGAQLSLVGFAAPDRIGSNQNVGVAQPAFAGQDVLAWTNPYVDARWPRMKAIFAVTAPGAPEAAAGRFVQEFDFEMPLPVLGQSAPIQQQFTTAHGAQIEVTRVATEKPQSNGNGDRLLNPNGTLTPEIRWQAPPGAPDAQLEFTLSIQEPGESLEIAGSRHDLAARLWFGKMKRPAPKWKTAPAHLQVKEFSTVWRQNQFFGLVSFDLPVAQLAQARALDLPAPPPQILMATAGAARAQLSTPQLREGRWRALLWTQTGAAPAEKNGVTTRLVPVKATWVQPDGQRKDAEFQGSGGDFSFDAHHQVLPLDGAGQRIDFELPAEWKNAPSSLEIEAQERKIYSFMHEFSGLPLPAVGETRELGEAWSDQSATVERVARLPGGWLVVVCQGTRLWNGQFILNSPGGFDDSGLVMAVQGWGEGDRLRPEAPKKTGQFSFYLGPPAHNAQTFDFAFGSTEFAPGARVNFRFDGLSIAR